MRVLGWYVRASSTTIAAGVAAEWLEGDVRQVEGGFATSVAGSTSIGVTGVIGVARAAELVSTSIVAGRQAGIAARVCDVCLLPRGVDEFKRCWTGRAGCWQRGERVVV